MNRFNWTYIGDNGSRHHIGLMHGPESGHLLIYCNSKIILIDFKILETKNYSFFIDEELCEIGIERKDGRFYYGFDINKHADTPRNRGRKKVERKHLYQSLAFLGSLFASALLVTFFLSHRYTDVGEEQWMAKINTIGKEALAKVHIEENSSNILQVNYFFLVNGKAYTTKSPFKGGPPIILENGMPLEEGDEFIVRYIPHQPNYNKIDFNRPTAEQMELYQSRSVAKHLSLNPELDSTFCSCLVNIAYDQMKIKGLANFLYQDSKPDQNPDFNINTYKRMTRDVVFQQTVNKECWD